MSSSSASGAFNGTRARVASTSNADQGVVGEQLGVVHAAPSTIDVGQEAGGPFLFRRFNFEGTTNPFEDGLGDSTSPRVTEVNQLRGIMEQMAEQLRLTGDQLRISEERHNELRARVMSERSVSTSSREQSMRSSVDTSRSSEGSVESQGGTSIDRGIREEGTPRPPARTFSQPTHDGL
jgi:hypothetical protein